MGSRLVEENFLDENNLKSDNELFLRRKRSEVKVFWHLNFYLNFFLI